MRLGALDEKSADLMLHILFLLFQKWVGHVLMMRFL